MNHRTVSVIIPVYNDERFIHCTLTSLQMQTFQDFEVILLDDCSTDSTFEIVQNEFPDDRIKVVHNEKNLGTAESRNRGLDIATGEYVYFMDHDDILFPHALQTLVDAMKKFGADVVHSQIFATIDENVTNKADLIKCFSLHKNISIPQDKLKTQLITDDLTMRLYKYFCSSPMYCGIWLNLYSRKFLKKFNIRCKTLVGEDLLYLFETLVCADKIVQIPDCIYAWRINSKSVSHRIDNKSIAQVIQSLMFVSSQMEQYFEIFDEIPHPLRFNIYNIYLQIALSNYQLDLFYKDSDAIEQADQILENKLRPIFGDQNLLIRALFHGNNQYLLELLRKFEG